MNLKSGAAIAVVGSLAIGGAAMYAPQTGNASVGWTQGMLTSFSIWRKSGALTSSKSRHWPGMQMP